MTKQRMIVRDPLQDLLAPKVTTSLPAAEVLPPEGKQLTANSLAGAVGYGAGMTGVPALQGSPLTPQISTGNTLFKNLRWYMVSNFRNMLAQAYVEIGIIQTMCDVPVDDALRGGLSIKSDQLTEDQLMNLTRALDRDDDVNTGGQAMKWNRLFGGAGILILTEQDPETPLDVDAINPGSKLKFRAIDMWELYWDLSDLDDTELQLENGEEINEYNSDFYTYYGMRVHKSRVLLLKGREAPSYIRPRLRGWGFSVVETLIRAINQYIKATDLTFELLDEFKLDIYKIKGLVNTLLAPGGTQKIQERVGIANWQKNYQHAVVMDSEDDYDHKQLSFAGMADVQGGIRIQVASEVRMPLTKLFGISAAGFNSGEDDIEVYNAMIESEIRSKSKAMFLRMLELRCQQHFGFIPDDLSIEFKALRVMSAEQEENVKTQKFSRLLQAKQSGLITDKEFRDGINKGNLFDISLDPDDIPETDMNDESNTGEVAAEAGGGSEDDSPEVPAPKGAKDPDAPGAKDVKGPKVENDSSFIVLPKRYTSTERAKRVLNSVAFDKASYKADGGASWIDARREPLFSRENAKDKVLWDKAAETAGAAGEDWRMVVWLYKKLGGRFW